MKRLGSHSIDKYTTGTLLGSSDDRGWTGLRAERWHSSEGELGEVEVCDTEVIVMIDGNLPIQRRGDGHLQKCNAVPGTVWICPSGVSEDMIHVHGEVRESLHLFLPASPLSQTALMELGVDPDKVELNYEGGFRDLLIEQIGREIRNEMLNPSPTGNMLVETLASALGAHIMRHHSNLDAVSVAPPAARGALDSRRLRRVKDFIEANLGDDLGIEALADEACLSPFHFARAFKAATGMTPHSYLSKLRIRRAKLLIAEGGNPLVEVAHLCGFSSQSYFTTWFKRLVGTTPGGYRANFGPCIDGQRAIDRGQVANREPCESGPSNSMAHGPAEQ